jgi:hypothetical protein
VRHALFSFFPRYCAEPNLSCVKSWFTILISTHYPLNVLKKTLVTSTGIRTRLRTFVFFGNTIAYICRWVTKIWVRKIKKHDCMKLYATLSNLLISPY